jgi:uncharacterized protein (DUF2141 family)
MFGAVSLACAAGAFEGGRSVAVVEEPYPGSTAIVGQVFDDETGEPVENGLAILQCLAGVRETSTNAGGAFGFRDLPPGTYTVEVLHGSNTQTKVITLGPEKRVRMRFTMSGEPAVRT